MITLTTKSGKKIGVNVERIVTIESDRDVGNCKRAKFFTNSSVTKASEHFVSPIC